jgi:hypothetical protein
MQYMAWDTRSVRTGELWSPGPLPSTVWVLDAGRPVVVNVRTMASVYYQSPGPAILLSTRMIAANKAILARCPQRTHPPRGGSGPWTQYLPADDTQRAEVEEAQRVLASHDAAERRRGEGITRRYMRPTVTRQQWQDLVAGERFDQLTFPDSNQAPSAA